MVFEIDIRTAAVDGVMLHERDGTPYWKLVKVCHVCNELLDDECLCFSDKETMEKARDEAKVTCGVSCWWTTLSDEEKAKECTDFRQAWAACLTDHSSDDLEHYQEDTDPLFLELLFEYIEDKWSCYDYSMAEAFDADLECPI